MGVRSFTWVLVGAALLAPVEASADEGPRLLSDGFYAGMRIDPGVAFSAAWDLDVYLDDDRLFSLGPRAELSVLGGEQEDGRSQDLMLTVDLVVLKIAVVAGESYRPWFGMGAGFLHYVLPRETVEDAAGMRTLTEEDGFGGVMSLGAGIDGFVDDHWGVSFALVTHIGFTGSQRIPTSWTALQLGFRFGI